MNNALNADYDLYNKKRLAELLLDKSNKSIDLFMEK